MYQSVGSLHQKLKDILTLFSKAGISVIEYRDYNNFADLVVDKPLDPQLFKKLYHDLLADYSVLMFQMKSDDHALVRLIPYVQQRSRIYKLRWILTFTTVITVFLTGIGLSQGFHSETLKNIIGIDTSHAAILLDAVLYTFIFLFTLISHELGHLIASKSSKIESEGPILIPAPPIQLGFVGTLGAIIFTKTPPPTRRDLARLGIMGPLMGIITATLFGLLGLILSPTITIDQAQKLVESGTVTPIGFISIGLYLLISLKPADGVILFHPVLFVTYFMYLVTFLNLLPVGQLDGGHVARSVLNARVFNAISTLTPMLLISTGILLSVLGLNGLYLTSIGILSLILYLITRRGHPGVANQYDNSKCIPCLVLYIILIGLTLPIPV